MTYGSSRRASLATDGATGQPWLPEQRCGSEREQQAPLELPAFERPELRGSHSAHGGTRRGSVSACHSTLNCKRSYLLLLHLLHSRRRCRSGLLQTTTHQMQAPSRQRRPPLWTAFRQLRSQRQAHAKRRVLVVYVQRKASKFGFQLHIFLSADALNFGRAPMTRDGQLEFELDPILDMRGRANAPEYLVQRKGRSCTTATWEPTPNITECRWLLQAFHRKYNRSHRLEDAELSAASEGEEEQQQAADLDSG
ncbi:hypothetical protein Esti_003775 [Eimeria stiedai]